MSSMVGLLIAPILLSSDTSISNNHIHKSLSISVTFEKTWFTIVICWITLATPQRNVKVLSLKMYLIDRSLCASVWEAYWFKSQVTALPLGQARLYSINLFSRYPPLPSNNLHQHMIALLSKTGCLELKFYLKCIDIKEMRNAEKVSNFCDWSFTDLSCWLLWGDITKRGIIDQERREWSGWDACNFVSGEFVSPIRCTTLGSHDRV